MIILASTSRYRAQLLGRLGLPFSQQNPDHPEQDLPDEAPEMRAARLAVEKARNVAKGRTDAIVIGSDQVATLEGEALHKPGSFDNAAAQLARMSNKPVEFYTGLAVIDTRSGEHFQAVDTTVAHTRELSTDAIERYLKADEPFDCAGSFKVEALGISLFDAINTNDPTALMGMPMIALCRMLRDCGLDLP